MTNTSTPQAAQNAAVWRAIALLRKAGIHAGLVRTWGTSEDNQWCIHLPGWLYYPGQVAPPPAEQKEG